MLFGPQSLPPVGKTAFEVLICSIRGSAKKGLQNLSCILMRFENCFKSALKVLSHKSNTLKHFYSTLQAVFKAHDYTAKILKPFFSTSPDAANNHFKSPFSNRG